jgi:ATP-dependent Clp protease ATP-binding subunit ClpA
MNRMDRGPTAVRSQILSGAIQVIGAASPESYRSMLESDRELAERFQAITVDNPTAEDTTAILVGLRPGLEQHHPVRISDAAIEAAVEGAQQESPEGSLPDRAIDLIDEASSAVRIPFDTPPPELVEAKRHLEQVQAAKDQVARNGQDDRAKVLHDEEDRTASSLRRGTRVVAGIAEHAAARGHSWKCATGTQDVDGQIRVRTPMPHGHQTYCHTLFPA